MNLDSIFETLGSYVMRDAAADAETRRKEATEQMVKIKDAEGVNVKKGDDGLLAPTLGDQINNFLGGLGISSAPTLSDVQTGYTTKQNKRKSSQLIDKNPNIDYTGIDRSDYDAVQTHTAFQTALKKATADGYNVSGITDLPGLKETIADQDLKATNKATKGSITYQDSRSDRSEDIARETAISDRNFGLSLTQLENQNSQALAALQAQIETAKMQNEQSILDREYLDRRDLRDYNYKIKQDKQESLDKIFALILGGVDKMF